MLRRALRAAWVRTIPPKPRPLILMYHRIADQPLDPWGTAVSPAHFAEHLEVLCRARRPLPLIDFVRGCRLARFRETRSRLLSTMAMWTTSSPASHGWPPRECRRPCSWLLVISDKRENSGGTN